MVAVGLEYNYFRMSGPLSTALETALKGASALTGATVSGDDVTVAGSSVPTVDIGAFVYNDNFNTTVGNQRVDGVTDTAQKFEQLKQQAVVTFTALVDYTVGSTYDLFLKDKTGVRLLTVETDTGRKYTQLVIIDQANRANTQDGEMTVAVTIANAGPQPVWE